MLPGPVGMYVYLTAIVWLFYFQVYIQRLFLFQWMVTLLFPETQFFVLQIKP